VHWRELHIKEKLAERVERKKKSAKVVIEENPLQKQQLRRLVSMM
jgi:hypothetical protein